MEERVGNVELVSRPLLAGDEGQDGANGGGLHDGRERLSKVDARALGVAPDDPACFVALERAICSELVLVHPFAGDDTHAGRTVDQRPGVVALQGFELRLHGGYPVSVAQS